MEFLSQGTYFILFLSSSLFVIALLSVIIIFQWRRIHSSQVVSGTTTNRKTLGEMNQLLAQTVKSAQDLITVTDLNDNIIFVNEALLKAYGYFEEELIGKPISVLRPEKPFEAGFSNILQETKEHGYHGVIINRRKDGSLFPIELWTSIVKDGDGNPIAMVGDARDVSDRERVKRELEREKNLLRMIIDNIPDNVFFKDVHGHYILNNRTHLKSLGVENQLALSGKTVFDLHPKELAEQYYADEQHIVTSKEPLIAKEEIVVHHDTGESRWHLTSKYPLLDDQGVVLGIIGISRDITRRKRADDALRKAHRDLEQINIELMEANIVKRHFVANMSHEIRTPLNAIVGMTGLLLNTELSHDQKDFAETIRTNSDLMLSLVNDILDFSKIDAEKMDIEKHPFEIRRCIEESMDVITTEASEKKLSVTYSLNEAVPSIVIGDVTRVRQILVNLLSNAVKFTDKGEIVVLTSAQLQDDNHYLLHFTVKDTGIGIPEDKQQFLFQSFSQIDMSKTRRFGGTGLGLALSKKICELMGGAIWVESTGIPGQGATFHFTIKVGKTADLQSSQNISLFRGKKILLVQDDEVSREIILRQMQVWSMIPTAVTLGSEATAKIRSGSIFDLVVIDMRLPYTDGSRLAGELKQILGESAPPFISISLRGMTAPENNSSIFAATLEKPIKTSSLYEIFKKALERQKPSPAAVPNTAVKYDAEIGKNHPLRILLAEDNAVNQKVALRFLERIGYRADAAFNGLEVLDALRRQVYDVVLMDGQMPEMDGEQATVEIRKQFPPDRQPRIIAMTANAMMGDRERYLSIGMDDYLAKPIRMEELVRALQESHALEAL